MRRLFRIAAMLGLVLAVALSAPAFAAGGDLDPSYGADGVARLPDGYFPASALARDGSLVTVGYSVDLGRSRSTARLSSDARRRA
jgi:hypothetical protein